MNEVLDRLRLTIGPLHYEFHAHDAWGVDALNRLRAHVVAQDFAGPAERILHLADLGMTREENGQLNRDWLPDRYAALLPEDSPRQSWRLNGDETGHLTAWNEDTRDALFVFGAIPAEHSGPFQLPWPLLLEDIIARGGGILHGGLVAHNGQGYIITAPPGGGKTTAVSRLSPDWRVFADDACLVWPNVEGNFSASPLPTWSVLLGRGQTLPAIGCWQIAAILPIAGVILLSKGGCDRLNLRSDLQSTPTLYRAISEHPRVVTNREVLRARLFGVARSLAKVVQAWELIVTLDGPLRECFDAVSRTSSIR